MTHAELLEFVRQRMRMSHVYQPLLIRALVDAGGQATLRQLAIAFLMEDESQIRYYEERIKRMPLPVLRRHGVVRRDGSLVSLDTPPLSYQGASGDRGGLRTAARRVPAASWHGDVGSPLGRVRPGAERPAIPSPRRRQGEVPIVRRPQQRAPDRGRPCHPPIAGRHERPGKPPGLVRRVQPRQVQPRQHRLQESSRTLDQDPAGSSGRR